MRGAFRLLGIMSLALVPLLTAQAVGSHSAAAARVASAWRTQSSDTLVAPSTAEAGARGTLRVTIRGLPPGVMGRVRVEGPEGFVRFVGLTTDVPLAPGAYTVVSSPFVTTDGRFRPARASTRVQVLPGQRSRASVRYRLVRRGTHPVARFPARSSDPTLVRSWPERASYAARTDFDPVSGRVVLHRHFAADLRADSDWLDPDPVAFRTKAPAGIYEVRTPDGVAAPLVVSTSPAVQRSRVAVMVPDFTWQAYNPAGGTSLYIPLGTTQAVSLARPLADAGEFNGNPISYFEQRVGQVDVIAQSAFDRLAGQYDLSKYDLLVLYGHDEYWTDGQRDAVERAVASGTNLLNMSGGTMWWRLEVSGGSIRRSGNWYAIGRPEESLLGASFRFAGYPLSRALPTFTMADYSQLLAQGFPADVPFESALRLTDGFRALDPGSPLLAGTGLGRGDWFGVDSRAARLEIDGLPLTPDGQPDPARMAGTASAGTALVAEAYAQMGRAAALVTRQHGQGRVVTLGSIGWVRALLAGDPTIVRITDNAFALLLGPP